LISERRGMAKKKNCLVFMDVSIDGDPVERMVFEVPFCLYELPFLIMFAECSNFAVFDLNS